jgi:hypothetical protein
MAFTDALDAWQRHGFERQQVAQLGDVGHSELGIRRTLGGSQSSDRYRTLRHWTTSADFSTNSEEY